MMKLFFTLNLIASSSAFLQTPTASSTRKATEVHISKRVINLIDKERYRQAHKEELKSEFERKNSLVLDEKLPEGYEFDDHMMEELLSQKQLLRDHRLAQKNPMAYCADRCLATGYCDVFEDVFQLSSKEVRQFCEECVLSESADGTCDIPEYYLEEGYKMLQP